MEEEIREEIEVVLRQMTAGRNYRTHSEAMVDRLYSHIKDIIDDDLMDNEDRLVVNEDMVITAMMMELS